MPTTTDKTVTELTTFRWSSSAETDRFPVEDPATGQVIAVIQGGGPEQVDALSVLGAVCAAFLGTSTPGQGTRGEASGESQLVEVTVRCACPRRITQIFAEQADRWHRSFRIIHKGIGADQCRLFAPTRKVAERDAKFGP